MEGREVKDRLYEQFALMAKAVSSAGRIELLELVAQRERTVEALAAATGMGVTNTSAHLQVLRRAGLVATRKDGTKVHYRIAGDDVVAFVGVLRDLARARLGEVDRVVRDYFESRDELEAVSRDELVERAGRGEVVVLDVRPTEEFAAGHIPRAWSVPLDQLTPSYHAFLSTPRSSPTAAARTACSPPKPSNGSGPAGTTPGVSRMACRNGASPAYPSR